MKIKSVKLFAIIFVLTVFGSSWVNTSGAKAPKKPRNIILFIGDGMGTAQVSAGMQVKSGSLFLELFPYAGFSKTFSADNYVTDSAAGGTAISCGVKTRNGMIGMAPDSTVLRSIIEIAHANGLATGIVSTSAVTHATPASFVAHNAGRGNYEDIAKDFLSGTVDVFIGGGENHFRKRADGADLTLDLKTKGYDVVYTLDDLKKSGSSKIAGLLSKEHMPSVEAGRSGMLTEMVNKAIETLSRDKDGFFLMVEGSMIDWGGHDKNIAYVVSEMIDLDDAIGAAYRYADQNKQTLIVVTADHETGGLTLTGGNVADKSLHVNFIQSGNHTAVMVPVFSFGPGAEKFAGILDNTYFFGEFLNLLKIK